MDMTITRVTDSQGNLLVRLHVPEIQLDLSMSERSASDLADALYDVVVDGKEASAVELGEIVKGEAPRE